MKFRVAEVFGPTVQGEGRQAGLPCYFVRFGGCDLRCVWCDTPHSVLPEYVARLPQLDQYDIYEEIKALPAGPNWVVITGGNPALFDLNRVVAYLQGHGYNVMVETQGTIFRDWLYYADEICISPKPPSSENIVTIEQVDEFLTSLGSARQNAYLKVVVFDMADYKYAQDVHIAFPDIEFFISAGTDAFFQPTVSDPHRYMEVSTEVVRKHVSNRYKWICEQVARDQLMRDVRVYPQLHVVAWGTERGH